MIFRSAILFAAVGLASAGVTPELFVRVASNDMTKDATDIVGRFEPKIKWSTAGVLADTGYDYEAGVTMRSDSLSTADVPFSVWGSLRRDVGRWNVKAKADTDSDDMRYLNVDVRATGGPTACELRAQGSFDTSTRKGKVREVGITQSFEAPGGDLRLNPRFNLAIGKADIKADYKIEKTLFTVEGDADKQKVTVAQRIDDNNEIAPSINSDGDISLRYRRNVGDGKFVATYEPDRTTLLEYKEGPWVASAEVPMDGFYRSTKGTKFSVRRSVFIEAS